MAFYYKNKKVEECVCCGGEIHLDPVTGEGYCENSDNYCHTYQGDYEYVPDYDIEAREELGVSYWQVEC